MQRGCRLLEYCAENRQYKNRIIKGNRKLRKIAIILLLGIFVWGCSVTRIRSRDTYSNLYDISSGNILESVKKQNVTSGNVFIQKAEIELLNQNGKQKFIGNIKFEYPDKYLISIKSRSGIEGVRIYITKDSIFVNDRINKKMYFGNSFYLNRKYGLSQSFLPLIFGDIVIDKSCNSSKDKCSGDQLKVSCVVKGVNLDYNIDCKKGKIVFVSQLNNSGSEGIKMKYDAFLNLENILIPRIIEIEDSQYNMTIKIKIVKVEYPWNGNVKFIPGKGYESIELL